MKNDCERIFFDCGNTGIKYPLKEKRKVFLKYPQNL